MLQKIAGEVQVAPVHIALAREGHGGRFQVGAFAQTDADLQAAQLLDVRPAAVQVALDDHAHRAVPCVQRVHQFERAIRIIARFHVDAHEAPQFRRAAHQLFDVGQAFLVS